MTPSVVASADVQSERPQTIARTRIPTYLIDKWAAIQLLFHRAKAWRRPQCDCSANIGDGGRLPPGRDLPTPRSLCSRGVWRGTCGGNRARWAAGCHHRRRNGDQREGTPCCRDNGIARPYPQRPTLTQCVLVRCRARSHTCRRMSGTATISHAWPLVSGPTAKRSS